MPCREVVLDHHTSAAAASGARWKGHPARTSQRLSAGRRARVAGPYPVRQAALRVTRPVMDGSCGAPAWSPGGGARRGPAPRLATVAVAPGGPTLTTAALRHCLVDSARRPRRRTVEVGGSGPRGGGDRRRHPHGRASPGAREDVRPIGINTPESAVLASGGHLRLCATLVAGRRCAWSGRDDRAPVRPAPALRPRGRHAPSTGGLVEDGFARWPYRHEPDVARADGARRRPSLRRGRGPRPLGASTPAAGSIPTPARW